MGGADATDPIDAVRVELTRLGARYVRGELHDRASVAWRGGSVAAPDAIERFARQVEWPPNHLYQGSVQWEQDLRLVRFGGLSPLSADFACAARHPFAIVGEYDGGNYLLVVALDDARPTDPIVYVVDPDETERLDLRRLGPLSIVLACIEAPTSDAGSPLAGRSSILVDGEPNPRCIVFHPDGRRVAWSRPGAGIEVWDVVARTRVRHVDIDGQVTTIRFLSDGVRAVSNRFYGSIVLWNIESGKVLAEFEWNDAFGGTTDALSPDGKTLVLCDEAGNVAVFDIESGRRLRSLPALLPYCATGEFHSDGRRVVFGVDRGKSSACVRVVDIESGREIFAAGASQDALSVRVIWSPDGSALIVGQWGKAPSVESWSLATGSHTTLGLQNTGVHCMVRHPDGRRIYTSGSEVDGVISVWDLREGRLETRLEGHTSGFVSLDCNDAGTRLVSAGDYDGTVRVWDIDR
jgi:WD40 repeat protein